FPLDLLEHARPAVPIGDVVFDREHAGVALLEKGQGGLQALLVAIAYTHLHPGIGCCARDSQTYAVRCSSDIGDLALQVMQRCRLRYGRLWGKSRDHRVWRGSPGDRIAAQTERGEYARCPEAVSGSLGEKATPLECKAIKIRRWLRSLVPA